MKLNLKSGAALGGLAIILAGAYMYMNPTPDGNDILTVKLPDLSGAAQAGHSLFKENCAACHGTNAGGTLQGPPLIHDIYNPGHHGDAAFFWAAKRGVRQHHWNFGNMPPLPHIKDSEIAQIITFIRETQRANGIKNKPHKM